MHEFQLTILSRLGDRVEKSKNLTAKNLDWSHEREHSSLRIVDPNENKPLIDYYP